MPIKHIELERERERECCVDIDGSLTSCQNAFSNYPDNTEHHQHTPVASCVSVYPSVRVLFFSPLMIDPHPQPSFLVPRPSRRPPITSLAATVKWQQTVGVGSVGRVPIHHREVSALVVSDEKGEGFYEEGDGVGSCI